MKVVGVSFVRNALKYAYPITEAIQSILPICDEVIVAVGDSEDNTLQLIQDIDSPKIRIIETVWDDSLKKGRVLSSETNKVLDGISEDADWCFYIQGDEAIHEDYLPVVKAAMKKYLDQPEVEGLLFKYKHFWGSYDYVADSRQWYRREVRVIRNDKRIRSYRDAQGFRKEGRKLQVKPIPAYIFHYGWVRPPREQQLKQLSFNKYWHDEEWIKENIPQQPEYDYSGIDSVKLFKGSHPVCMQARIDKMNWSFEPESRKLSLKERFSRFIEKLTGHRIGEYQNFKII